MATLHGVTIASAELPLTKGLRIAQRDALAGAARRRAVGTRAASSTENHLIVVYTAEQDDAREAALLEGRAVLNDLLSALRLFGDGRVSARRARLGAHRRRPWTPLALGAGGRPHGMLVVTAEQEDELRAFCNLVSRRAPHDNDLAWALRRFELGCERETPYEALTDNLLALRALLEPEGPASALPRRPARRALRDRRAARRADRADGSRDRARALADRRHGDARTPPARASPTMSPTTCARCCAT